MISKSKPEPKSKPAAKPRRVVATIVEVAKHFGVSSRWASTWFAEKGAPKRADGRFDLVAIAKWRDTAMVKAGRDPELAALRKLTLEMEVELRSIDLELKRKRWLPIDTINQAFAVCQAESKLYIENLPYELATVPVKIRERTARVVCDLADGLVREVCNAIADSFDEKAKAIERSPGPTLPEDTPAPEPNPKPTPQVRLARLRLEEVRDELRAKRSGAMPVDLVRELYTFCIQTVREHLATLPERLAAEAPVKEKAAKLLAAEAQRQIDKSIEALDTVWQRLEAELAA
ncbi:MAG: hypothetical protein AB7U73_05080 [Pirellulales bacterium]